MKTYFVVRDTIHPQEDLERNWSAWAGGSENGEQGGETEEEARENYADHLGINICEVSCDFRYHPAYEEFVAVHYEGLGAFELNADNIEDALKEAAEYEEGLAVCMDEGSGSFDAVDCVGFHKVREGRYVFEIKMTW